MIGNIPLPARDGAFEAGFWTALDRGELAHLCCTSCGQWHFPARWRCTCGSPLEYRAVSGRASLWSWTEVHPPVLPAFAQFTPYVVGIAELDDAPGVRMVGALLIEPTDPINRVRPSELAIGMPLRACILTLGEGIRWPAWQILK